MKYRSPVRHEISGLDRDGVVQAVSHLDGLSPQHDEALRALHQESGKLVAQNTFDLIGLLDLDANANRVHRGLDEHPLIFIA